MRQRQLIDWFNNMESTTFRELFPVHELTEEISGFFGYIKTRLPRHSLFAAQQQLNAPSGANDKAALAALQAKERKEAELLLRMQRAAEEKDMAALSGLFSPANVDRPVKDAMRLSDLAAALGSTPMLQLVLDHGGQINAKNAAGQLPIHYALTSPEVPATVAYLLERGADPNIPMPNGDFLMHKACSDSATTLLDLLLYHQADPGCLDSQRHTPLHRACINDLREHAEIVLKAAPDLINQQDAFGRTALHIAVENQNIQLMKMLLERGATIDRETENGMTAIDSMMVTKNRGALKELIVYFTEKVSKDVRAYKMTDLYRSKHFRQFLNVLKLIDSEACKCYYRAREEDLEQKRETELKLVNDLLDVDEENTQDVMDFQSKMMAALKTGAIHDCTDNREIIDTIAIFTTKYILFREDVSMLQDVMHCGVIWRHVSQFLEEHIATLYSKTNKDASIISKLFAEQFIEYSAGGKRAALRRTALVKKVGDVLGMYQLSRVNVAHCLEVTNPIDTLPIWSILTGKMNLTLEFLSQVQFEAVPVCLMAAGLLRNLHKVLNVDTLELPSIAVLADQCEIFACKVVERMCMVDVSEHKKTTYQYLLQILPAFDNLNCLHLAANCGCDTFLRLDTCQKAMDVAWYRFLLDVNPIYREIIIALGCIPLNPLVSIALYRDYRRLAHAEQERRLSLDAVQSADQTEGSGSGGGGGGGSSRNRRTSFMIEDDDTRDATSTMFSDALEFQPPDPRLHGGTMAAKVSECCTLYYYFYQIPAVKFRYFTISHLVLLCTLSYVVQFQLNASITALEVFVYITAFGFVVEEAKKFVQSIWRQKLLDYVRNKWNIFDFVTSLIFLTGFVLRLVVLEYEPYSLDQTMLGLFDNRLWYCTRAFLGTYCLLLWVKLLNTSRVHQYFGPKLKMIYKMIIKDLLPFLFILIIFLLGFGILMCSLLYPNGYYAYNPNRMSLISMAKRLVQFCFFSVFGEYHLDTVNGENCEEVYTARTNNTLPCPNPQSTFIVPYILLPLYVTITTILLLSLIVALFSKTIEEIDCNSTALWQFERFFFIASYASNSSLPPPLNVLDMGRELLLKVCHRYLEQPQKPIEMDFFNQDVALKALIYQAIGMRNYRSELLITCANTKEAKAATIGVKRSASLFHH
ncbi:hypothetical protein BOX15_Mlig021145g1 [Macrostomum lignano]|uniref:Ion transport domain-containing protein n=1 Tax=Macrostomum lignano TaxID=282301 RepID=A0A267FA52_9PLAT|nr:hypothetical protein BOX15_Mlig021145g2 [Macrostomum lignano]PAA70084.1 hypothetical protein BOX15_Mlig021145g1 [Macrostomum lignano]